MNRQMRRAKKREILKQDTELISGEELALEYERVKRESVKQAVELYSLSVMMVLHDKLGFGQKRILRFNEQVQDLVEGIGEGYLSLDDMKKVLVEECKINVG